MSRNKLSSRGARIVKALEESADDLDAGVPIESRYTVRTMRVIILTAAERSSRSGDAGTHNKDR
jgi:hypothetical protein